MKYWWQQWWVFTKDRGQKSEWVPRCRRSFVLALVCIRVSAITNDVDVITENAKEELMNEILSGAWSGADKREFRRFEGKIPQMEKRIWKLGESREDKDADGV